MKGFTSVPLVLPRVPAVFCAGLNFTCHAKEVGLEGTMGKYPIFTMKSPSSVVVAGTPDKPNTVISIPKFLQQPPDVDYEGELAVVIGKRCKNVPVASVPEVVDGFACSVDFTARRWQGKKGGGQWTYSKSFDSFCPIGPSLTRVDHFDRLKDVVLSTTLNGSVVQRAPLSNMVFGVAELISFLSQGSTLEPGTLVLCGTPAGVGFRRTKSVVDPTTGAMSVVSDPYYVKDGDLLEVAISHFEDSLKCEVKYE